MGLQLSPTSTSRWHRQSAAAMYATAGTKDCQQTCRGTELSVAEELGGIAACCFVVWCGTLHLILTHCIAMQPGCVTRRRAHALLVSALATSLCSAILIWVFRYVAVCLLHNWPGHMRCCAVPATCHETCTIVSARQRPTPSSVARPTPVH
jgi:hypothetical protein